MELTDYDIIKRILSGEQELFSELVTRYKRLVYSVVYNMLNDQQEVNDVSQEVFIRIYQSLGRYNPEFKFSTWTVKIATNLCLDILRKRKVESLPMDDITETASSMDTPEARYLKKERSKRIRDAIEELPEKYRLPVILFHQNGMSYEEMMKALDEPMTIIKNRLYRARLMLRDKLSKYREEGVL